MVSARSIALLAGSAVILAAGTAWWLLGGRAIDASDPGQVALGARLYTTHCAECHGATLEGEADWRTRKPSGELPAPPHDASGHTWHHPDEQLFAITKHGMARYAPPDYKSAMPGFVGKLSDRDIRAIIAFIKSTWPEDLRRRQQGLNRN